MDSLLITFEYPPDIGGVATYYYNIVQNKKGAAVLHLTYSKKTLSWVNYLNSVRKAIKNNNVSFLEIGHILPLGFIGLIFKLFYHKPFLVYIHGMDILQSSLNNWKKFWIKVILREASVIIANSNFVKNSAVLKYHIDKNKIDVKYPFLDIATMEKESEKLTAILKPKNTKVILTVARLVKRKGIDMAIEALKEVKDNFKFSIEYWIIGEGPDRERLQFLAQKYQIKDKIKFLGNIPFPQIYKYYEASDVFIMPCREIDGDVEGFGIVFLEAAVFKKPVIGGRNGGVHEAILNGVTGLLVDSLDVKEITTAISRILKDEEFGRKLGERGYERVKKEFAVYAKSQYLNV